MSSSEKLRFITYLSPGIPIELFETIMNYLEEVTGKDAYLITESRYSGPPPDKTDPFTANEVDIGFMCSSGFLRMYERRNKNIELCKAGIVPSHAKTQNRPIYFSEVIVHAANSEKYNALHDLRGHKIAYNDPMSLSGSLAILAELKKMGFNASFFGDAFHSGSHLNSIQLVLDQKVDAAAIDSNTLSTFLASRPEYKNMLKVVMSLGPLPIYPVVFNANLSEDLKKKITDALLSMHKDGQWKAKLNKLFVDRFTEVDMSLYQMDTDLRELVKGLSISAPAYY